MSRLSSLVFAALFAVAFATPARAVEPGEMLADQKLETRAREISSGLRCLVCQNQSIDDSEATLAKDLRLLVRDRLQSGDTDSQVRDFLVARYGSFVLLKPPFEPGTILLWGVPLLCLGVGGTAIALAVRRRRTLSSPALTPGEQATLERLTRDGV